MAGNNNINARTAAADFQEIVTEIKSKAGVRNGLAKEYRMKLIEEDFVDNRCRNTATERPRTQPQLKSDKPITEL